MPVSFLTDEDFDGRILSGLLLRLPDLDIVRVQDVGLQGEQDPPILEWAFRHGRVILTHDERTMPRHVLARQRAGLPISGVCVVRRSLPIGPAIDALEFIALCSRTDEWEHHVRFVPLS